MGTLAISIVSFILGGFLVLQLDKATYTVLPPVTTLQVTAPTPAPSMLTLINQARILADIPEVKPNPVLDGTAMIKACDMRDRNYFEHKDPDGRMPWHLFIEAGYNYDEAGENLVQGSTDPMTAMFYLMSSEGHRKNILDSRYTEIGIAVCGKYTVQHFGDL